MFDVVWAFLKDPSNHETLTWLAGGIAVVAGAIWAVFTFFFKKDEPGAKPSVSAKRKSVAIVGDVTNSPINIGTRSSHEPREH